MDMQSVDELETVFCTDPLPIIPYRMCIADDEWDGTLEMNALDEVLLFNDERDWDEINVIADAARTWTEKCKHLSIATLCLECFSVTDCKGTFHFVSDRE